MVSECQIFNYICLKLHFMLYKIKILLFFILCSKNVDAFQTRPIHMQVYSGLNILNLGHKNNPLLYNLGFNFMPTKTIFIIGIENQIHYSNHQYEWPGEGTYHYKRTIDILCISGGVILFKTKRINPILGVVVNNSFFNGKAESENTQLKDYLKSYNHRTINLCYLLKINMRITDNLSAYVSQNFILVREGDYAFRDAKYASVFGCGLAYNFYQKKISK